MITPGALVGVAALCLLAQAMYSGAEIALLSAPRSRLKEQAAAGHRGAEAALEALAHEDRLIATSMIGTTLFLVLGVAAVTSALASKGVSSPAIAAAVYAPFAVVLGDALPRRIHLYHSSALAPWAGRLMAFSRWPFSPLLPVTQGWARVMTRLAGASERSALTRKEILSLLQADPADDSPIAPEEHRMIQRVFAIGETSVGGCMTPLVEVDAVPVTASVQEAIAIAVRNGHTRLPVFQERVDHIVGIVHARDLLFGTELHAPIADIARPVRYVPESKRVDELLHDLRQAREPLAVVVDEYGGSVGIVTIEDLLEEIIGEIRDERDTDVATIRKVSDTEWRVPARVDIETLEAAIGRRLPKGDFSTVAGMVLATLGRIPRKGEICTIGGVVFRVEEANERAIKIVHVSLGPVEEKRVTRKRTRG